jgi:uncharacterized membrane protein
MAADEDFPRGWTTAARSGAGVQIAIILPAPIGDICHVITAVSASLTAQVAGNADAFVEILDPLMTLANGNPLIELSINAALVNQQATASWTGKLLSTRGMQTTIRFNAVFAGFAQQLVVAWYDI